MRSNLIFILLLVFGVLNAYSQSVNIQGKISAADEVDGIHIINKTANRFAISNPDGSFIIPAKLNDTILFSGVSYQLKEVIATKLVIVSQLMSVHLEALVNALDEVVVGKLLTGDLNSDLANSDVQRDINFFDLGIPGYTGKPLTQSERRLKEASGLDLSLGGSMGGGGVGMSLNPIINGITGRTKKLKEQVKLEKLDDCLHKVKSNLSDMLFEEYPLDEIYRTEFFYFCSDDDQFYSLCRLNNNLRMFEFLVEQLLSFKMIVYNKNQD